MYTSAVISDCGLYRYTLTRRWAEGSTCTFIMLNPSTADANLDDPTIRRCINFAKREGCGALMVVNLWAFRATDPKHLPDDEARRLGPENRRYLDEVFVDADGPLIAAWGVWGAAGATEIINRHGPRLLCLGWTKDGHPRHPLYVSANASLLPLVAKEDRFEQNDNNQSLWERLIRSILAG